MIDHTSVEILYVTYSTHELRHTNLMLPYVVIIVGHLHANVRKLLPMHFT